MEYTDAEIKTMLLISLEEYGYYYAAWVDTGSEENKVDSAYHQGQSVILGKFYSIRNFRTTKEGRLAFQKGEDKYNKEIKDSMKEDLIIKVIEEPAKPMAWVINVNNTNAPNSIFAISKTINSLIRHMESDKDNQLNNINSALESINPETVNPYHMVAVLRSLYSVRVQVPSWKVVEKNLRQRLSERGLNSEYDANVLMHGLDE
jgi:hypothetical protein